MSVFIPSLNTHRASRVALAKDVTRCQLQFC